MLLAPWRLGCCLVLLALPALARASDGVIAERRAALETSLAHLATEEAQLAKRIHARTKPVSEREVELARLEAELAQAAAADLDEVAIATLRAQWEAQRDGVAAELRAAEQARATAETEAKPAEQGGAPAEQGGTPTAAAVALLRERLATFDSLLASDAPAREIIALQRRLESRRAAVAALRADLLDERFAAEQRAAAAARLENEARDTARRIATLEAEQQRVEQRRGDLEAAIQRAETAGDSGPEVDLLRAQADLITLQGYQLAEEMATARAHYTTARLAATLEIRRGATSPASATAREINRRLADEQARLAALDHQVADLQRRRQLYETRRAALDRQAELLTALAEEEAATRRVSVVQRQAVVDQALAAVNEHARLLADHRAAEEAFINEMETALHQRADVRLGYRTPRAWSLARLPEVGVELAALPYRLPVVVLPSSGRILAATAALLLGLLAAVGTRYLRLATRRGRARLRWRVAGYRGIRALIALLGVAGGLAPPTLGACGIGVALYLLLPGVLGTALLALLTALWASVATRVCFRYLRWLLRGGRVFSVTIGRRRGWHWLARFFDLVWFYLAIGYALVAVDAPPAALALLNDAATTIAIILLPLLGWRRPPVFRTPGPARLAFFLLLAAAATLLGLALAGYSNLATAIFTGAAVTTGLVVVWGVGTLIAADLWRRGAAPGGRLIRLVSLHGEEAIHLARTLTRLTSLLLALGLLLWKDPTQALFASPLWQLLTGALHHPLVHIGTVEITTLSVLQGGVIFAAFLFTSRLVRRLRRDRLYPRTRLDAGVRNTINSFVNYGLLTLGVLVALQAVGIKLTTLTVFAGALGVGLGFGLQNIANNFVSGLILLLERPLKTGDYIDIGATSGVVTRIGARSTQIRTRDNIAIVVPNSELISQSLTNWSLDDARTRLHVGVGVAYGTDPRRVEEVLLKVAKAHPKILATPPPRVWFQDFGASSLDFELLGWVDDPAATPLRTLRSELRFAIYTALTEANIEIPFPQRDLHIRSWSAPPPPAAPAG